MRRETKKDFPVKRERGPATFPLSIPYVAALSRPMLDFAPDFSACRAFHR